VSSSVSYRFSRCPVFCFGKCLTLSFVGRRSEPDINCNDNTHLDRGSVEANPVYVNRVLIVDDEPTLVFFLRRGLSEAGLNCEVEGVNSGEEALGKLAFDKYRPENARD
jgi:hypothetical protein